MVSLRLSSVVLVVGGVSLGLTVLFGESGEGALPVFRVQAQDIPMEPMRLEVAFLHLAFTRPVHLTHAGDGTDRLWMVSQNGLIQVFPNDPATASTKTFLDIRDQVNDAGNEEGLLGLAFDPDYASNGYFYVYYSAADPRRSVLSRFSVRGDDPDLADPDSELVLLEVRQPYVNHNGGMVEFGPDGHLYLGLGDGGAAGDPHGNGQDRGTLLGSILRIDVRDSRALSPYRIPSDNPFVGVEGARAEVWAYGFRNPWRFSFDSLTGALWAADVGQDRFEEVDLGPSGAQLWLECHGGVPLFSLEGWELCSDRPGAAASGVRP